MKKVKRRMPGGALKFIFKRKMHSKHKCAICSGELSSVPRGKPTIIKRLTRSARRPTRPFGGQLCSKCMRKVVAMKAKLKLKAISADAVPISLREYVIGK